MTKQTLKDSFPIYRHRLDNGLDVVIVENKKAPVVCVNMTYKVGSKDERAGSTGFAHLFEHLMFEGSKNVPKGDFDRLCSLAGGANNAYTTYDWTSYYMTVPTHQLELGLWLEADRLFNFSVTAESLKTQKSVVSEEIRQTVENQPYGRWREFMAKSAFKENCSYSWEVHGRIEDVENAKISSVRSFHKKYYNPANACLVICGNVSHGDAMRLVNKYCSKTVGNNSLNGRRSQRFYDGSKLGGAYIEFEDNVPLPAVFLSYHYDGFLSEISYTADIIALTLGGGRSSRLYDSLVYDKQIASSVGAFADKRENASLLTVYVIASNQNISCEELYDSLIMELDSLVKDGISMEENEKARAQAASQLALELQSSAGIADLTAHNTIFFDAPGRVFSLLDNYYKVTTEEVAALASKLFKKENSVRIDVRVEKR